MNILRKIAKISLWIGAVLALVFYATCTPIERAAYQTTDHYKKWKEELKSILVKKHESSGEFKIGWAKENITPTKKMPLAGYGKRKGANFDKVHDSIYVRALAVKSGVQTVYFVSADLLILPPNVKVIIENDLKKEGIGLSHIHFSAIHSHNSVGGWGNSLTGRLFAGSYEAAEEIFLAKKIELAIRNSTKYLAKTEISYAEVVDCVDVKNRLNGVPGFIDPEIRLLNFKTIDNKNAQLITYGAHATVLNSTTFSLSRDYPGALVDKIEKSGVDFAIYMAGAVGSMGPIEKGFNDFDEVNNQAEGVFKHVQNINSEILKSKTVTSFIIDLPLADPHPRISKNWGLRSYLFSPLFGNYPAQVKYTKIGTTLIIGLPCDFSGELMVGLDKYAKSQGINLIITSFNGGYIGYVVADNHYDQNLYESTTMSWYGYQNGAYLTEVVQDLIDLK